MASDIKVEGGGGSSYQAFFLRTKIDGHMHVHMFFGSSITVRQTATDIICFSIQCFPAGVLIVLREQ